TCNDLDLNNCCFCEPICYLSNLYPNLVSNSHSTETKPCTLAIPSPFLLISVTSTSYSLPTSTNFGAGELLLIPLLPHPPTAAVTTVPTVIHL
ncbi:MAG: hypothetical protein WAM14_00920, partial [Candidatus Nitrosopolaris sp.]